MTDVAVARCHDWYAKQIRMHMLKAPAGADTIQAKSTDVTLILIVSQSYYRGKPLTGYRKAGMFLLFMSIPYLSPL